MYHIQANKHNVRAIRFSAFRKGHAIETMHEMSKKYGGVFSLFLGMFLVLHFHNVFISFTHIIPVGI